MGENQQDENHKSKAFVKNASDKEQVKEAGRKERDRKKIEMADLREILALPVGRRFLWRMLAKCKTFGSVWHPSALIHFNAGQQDVGHALLAEINEADPAAFLKLMQENYKPTD